MFRSVDAFIRNADYPSAIREHIKVTSGNQFHALPEREQNRLINNAQLYCDNAMIQFLADRAKMEKEFR
jgi:hypothetical protein